MASGRSLMYSRKKSGSNVEPCGTPSWICCSEELVLPKPVA